MTLLKVIYFQLFSVYPIVLNRDGFCIEVSVIIGGMSIRVCLRRHIGIAQPIRCSFLVLTLRISVIFITALYSICYCAQRPVIWDPIEAPQVTIVPRPRPQSKGASSDIRVDVNVVLIPVTVTDRLGNPVPGLPAEVFHVAEDGIEQTISRVVMQDAPVSIGFIFDTSRSMENKLEKSRDAISEILKTAVAGDEYFLAEP